MSLNKDLLIRQALLDVNLAPVDKIVFLAILEEYQDNIVEDLRSLMKYLTLQEGRVVKELKHDRLEASYLKLTRLGYIGVEGAVVPKQESPIEDQVDILMEYISEARIVRGYSKRKLNAGAYKESIRQRLRDGRTLEQCMAVINYRFESDWHKKHPKFLVPSTVFEKTKFATALSEIEDVKHWAYLQVTKYGVSSVQEEKVVGEM